jgi:hypothetical protein
MNLLAYPKRTWHYIQHPVIYGISCDLCGGSNIHWSEWARHIWCYDCEVDTRGNPGIFDGPIPVNLCQAMGISFERVYL